MLGGDIDSDGLIMAGNNPRSDDYINSLVVAETGANAVIVGGAPGATSGTGGLKAGTVSDATGTLNAVRTGAFLLPSQATGNMAYCSNPAGAWSVISGTGLVQMNGSSAPTIVSASTAVGGWRLIGSGSGTSTAGAATNVFTQAITGLTVLDTLHIDVTMTQVGGSVTTAPVLYNVTDSVVIATSVNITAGNNAFWNIKVTCLPALATAVHANTFISLATAVTTPSGSSTFTTAFTGSWTLALRTGASGTDGTFHYAVRVYKVLGQ